MKYSTYIRIDIDSQVAQIAYHLLLLLSNLCVSEELGEILLGNAILDHYIKSNDANFVVVGDTLKEKSI